ncbi:hypothetical protein HK26_11605 [Acetobacter okinawensis]|uniref:Uncharacterized protein n=2 Tax=Acetobacter okinawensis TaxID=1076594 RepID=A0A252BR57_9PROT|nr:hypothetical protein HK26_11605 [Acetobacter okinawensis]
MSAPRIRKAWRVTVCGYDFESTVYAHSAGKARYQVFLDVTDTNNAISFPDIRVLRHRGMDRIMPEIPTEAEGVSKIALAKLLHACGATREQPEKCGSRDYFYCSANDTGMAELVNAGLMQAKGKGWASGECYFHATQLGQIAAHALCPLYRGDDFVWPEVTA